MPARTQTRHQENHRSTIHGYMPVLLALALLVASRTSVCVVIASDQDVAKTSQPANGQPPEPKRQLETDSSIAPVRTDGADRIDASSAEISRADDFSNLGSTAEESLPTSDSVRTLSVEIGSVPLFPADKPAWVGNLPDLSSTQHRVFVGSSPESTEAAAEQSLDAAIEVALHEYVDAHVLKTFGAAARLPITADYARKNLLEDALGYVAQLKTSNGPMFQKWVILRISPEQREQMVVWHKESIQRERLGRIGFGLLLLLGGTGTAHLLLSRSSRVSAPKQLAVELPAVLPSKPKRPKGFLSAAIITVCMLAVASQVALIFGLRHRSKSPSSRVSVEVRHDSAREHGPSKDRQEVRVTRTKSYEKDD